MLAGVPVGLVAMRERIRMVDGACDVQSRPGAGTRVIARVPLRMEGPA